MIAMPGLHSHSVQVMYKSFFSVTSRSAYNVIVPDQIGTSVLTRYVFYSIVNLWWLRQTGNSCCSLPLMEWRSKGQIQQLHITPSSSLTSDAARWHSHLLSLSISVCFATSLDPSRAPFNHLFSICACGGVIVHLELYREEMCLIVKRQFRSQRGFYWFSGLSGS